MGCEIYDAVRGPFWGHHNRIRHAPCVEREPARHGQRRAAQEKRYALRLPPLYRQRWVYRRLLPVLCPHLPQIMEVAEQDGQTAVLEEYMQGDTLAELLAGATLTEREARQVTLDLCKVLHVLHSMGAVHRDVKPENVILRGSDAVLIDFDAARICKDESESDARHDRLCRARAALSECAGADGGAVRWDLRKSAARTAPCRRAETEAPQAHHRGASAGGDIIGGRLCQPRESRRRAGYGTHL